jgi:hypothetical protein
VARLNLLFGEIWRDQAERFPPKAHLPTQLVGSQLIAEKE